MLSDLSAAPTRRRFLGYVLAGSTLAVAAQVGGLSALAGEAKAATPVPSNPQVFDAYDLSDLIRASCRPTNHLLTITLERNGTAVFDMPRAEVGQGVTSAMAMIIAEELDLPVEKVRITLADGRPELVFNQLTGGSSTLYSLYEPVRIAAALARQRIAGAAAAMWGVPVAELTLCDGIVTGPQGQTAGYGSLTEAAASSTTRLEEVVFAPDRAGAGGVVGKARNRVDALSAVTGRK